MMRMMRMVKRLRVILAEKIHVSSFEHVQSVTVGSMTLTVLEMTFWSKKATGMGGIYA